MTNEKLDQLIDDDLALLGENAKVNLPTFAESMKRAGVDGGIYRDGNPGAEARRDALLAQRQTELALLPMSAARVYVHRVSRAAAGLVALIGAIAIGLAVADPLLMRLASFMIPELSLSLAIAGLAAVVLAAYVVAGWIAERVFEDRMRKTVQTSGDAFKDLDALAQGPIDEARRLARSVDSWAVGLPIAGIVANVPLFAFLALLHAPIGRSGYSGLHLGMYGVPGSLFKNLLFIGFAVAIGLAIVFVLAKACRRQSRGGDSSRMIRLLSHWGVLVAASIVGLVVVVAIGRATFGGSIHALPGTPTRALLAVAGTLAVFAPTAWLALRHRRREQARLTHYTPGNSTDSAGR